MTNTPTVLLIELDNGETVGVRFPSQEAARDWEDAHPAALVVRGCVRIVGRREALSSGPR